MSSEVEVLKSKIEDMEADLASVDVELEDEKKKVKELELKLDSISSDVEYVEYNKKRNKAMEHLRRKLVRRDEKIEDLEARVQCLEKQDLHMCECLANARKEVRASDDKIAEQAQELVELRKTASQFPTLKAELKRANNRLAEDYHEIAALRDRLLTRTRSGDHVDGDELKVSQDDLAGFAARESGPQIELTDNDARSYLATVRFMKKAADAHHESYRKLAGEVLRLRAENARMSAAEDYLSKNRGRSYLAGVVSAAGNLVWLVKGGRR